MDIIDKILHEKVIKIRGVPHPWSYNPSSFKQRVIVAIIAFPAVLISVYLGLYQWGFISDPWDPVFGEQTRAVLDSDVSHKLRATFIIPDAILGTVAYLGDILFALAGSERRWQYRPWLVILFGIDVIPLGLVSAILIFLQATIVGHWCFLCMVTAVISLVLIVVAYDEIAVTVVYLTRFWKRTKSFKKFIKVFFGYPSKEADEVAETMIVKK